MLCGLNHGKKMRPKTHFRIFAIATIVWLLFFIAGMPNYYLQYSNTFLLWFVVLLIIPFSVIIFFVFKPIKKSKRIKLSIWYSFYFTIPLFIYDSVYCGIYLEYGYKFILTFWFLSVYYIIPWILFPTIALLLNQKNE
jgi:hypothetical protein